MTRSQLGGRLTRPVDSRDHSLGLETAPVTLVEYGDYQCPYCGRAYPVVKELERRMGENLRFIFRNFPLSEIHPNALQAAELAEAADAEGKFWEMHGVIFEHQKALGSTRLLEYARSLGLAEERVAAELASGVHRARIREDFMSGVMSGVNGTPTFFINGVRYDGEYDLEPMLIALESAENPSDLPSG